MIVIYLVKSSIKFENNNWSILILDILILGGVNMEVSYTIYLSIALIPRLFVWCIIMSHFMFCYSQW